MAQDPFEHTGKAFGRSMQDRARVELDAAIEEAKIELERARAEADRRIEEARQSIDAARAWAQSFGQDGPRSR